MSQFVYKAHKWLAVSAGLATVVWFLSGIVMILPVSIVVKPVAPDAAKGSAPSFNEIRVSIPQAIATVEAAVGHQVEVTSFASKQVLGRTLIQLSTRRDGTYLIDAVNGGPFEIDREAARRIAIAAGADLNAAAEPVMVHQWDTDYLYGPLPAYKVASNDALGTMYFVTAEGGDVRATNRWGRLRGFLAGTHSLDFLRPVAGGRVIRALMLLFALLGTAMSLFGAWILWMQFRNWRQMRRQSA